jgi:hypothetical protein
MSNDRGVEVADGGEELFCSRLVEKIIEKPTFSGRDDRPDALSDLRTLGELFDRRPAGRGIGAQQRGEGQIPMRMRHHGGSIPGRWA